MPPSASGIRIPVKPNSANCFHKPWLKPSLHPMSRNLRKWVTGASLVMKSRAVSRSIFWSSVKVMAMLNTLIHILAPAQAEAYVVSRSRLKCVMGSSLNWSDDINRPASQGCASTRRSASLRWSRPQSSSPWYAANCVTLTRHWCVRFPTQALGCRRST